MVDSWLFSCGSMCDHFSDKGIYVKGSPIEVAEISDVVITMFLSSRHGGGTVATVRVEQGTIKVGEEMSVQKYHANATVKDVLDRAGEGSYRWSQYGFSVKQELIAKLNQAHAKLAITWLVGQDDLCTI
ncbi:probable GTP diphosphokinase RSH2, chloroplastic [Tanacetum coccineum]